MSRLTFSDKAGIISIGKFLAAITGLATLAILARYLSKDDYGSYRQIWLIFTTLLRLFAFGLPQSIYYYLQRCKTDAEKKGFIIQMIMIMILIGAVFSICLYLSSNYIAIRFNNPELEILLKIFALYPVLMIPTLILDPILISFDLPKQIAVVNIINKLLSFLFTIVPIMLGFDLPAMFKIVLSLAFFQLLFTIYIVLRPILRDKIKFDFKMLIEQIRYATPLGMSSIVGAISGAADKAMISLYFAAGEYATYANGAVEIPLIVIVTSSVTSVLMPELVKRFENNQVAEMLALWHNAIRKVALIFISMMSFFIVFGNEIIVILFSEKYLGSVIFFQIYLCALPMRVANYGPILMAIGKTRYIFTISIIGMVSNIVLNYIFIRLFGMKGAAIASVIAAYLLALLSIMAIKKELGVSLASVFPWKMFLKMSLISLVVAFCTLPIHKLNLNPVLTVLLAGIVYLAGIGFIFKKINLFMEDDINMLKRWLSVLNLWKSRV